MDFQHATINFKFRAKRALQKTGLFPAARAMYRGFNRDIIRECINDQRFYSNFIEPGDLVFDIGANLGQKAVVFLRCGAKVIGLEPNPRCHPTLRFEYGKNSNFELVPKALGASEGRMPLHFVGTAGAASLLDDWEYTSFEGRPEKVEVEVTTLDRLITQYGDPSFCKIDVEGFELEVLRGLSQPLKCISFEYLLRDQHRFLSCLKRMQELSDVKINVIALNEPRFALREWISPGELDVNKLPPVGDCFVVPA